MHIHPLHTPDPLRIVSHRLGSVAAASGPILRYVILSTLAFFFFTTPISFREVSHVSHRSASRT